jgi:hypothetical protein
MEVVVEGEEEEGVGLEEVHLLVEWEVSSLEESHVCRARHGKLKTEVNLVF